MYVTIVDENDNAPVFQKPHYEVVLDEGPDTINASLITIQALDLDEGPNGTVTYAIVAGNIINTFRIDRHKVSSWEQGPRAGGVKASLGLGDIIGYKEQIEPRRNWSAQRQRVEGRS